MPSVQNNPNVSAFFKIAQSDKATVTMGHGGTVKAVGGFAGKAMAALKGPSDAVATRKAFTGMMKQHFSAHVSTAILADFDAGSAKPLSARTVRHLTKKAEILQQIVNARNSGERASIADKNKAYAPQPRAPSHKPPAPPKNDRFDDLGKAVKDATEKLSLRSIDAGPAHSGTLAKLVSDVSGRTEETRSAFGDEDSGARRLADALQFKSSTGAFFADKLKVPALQTEYNQAVLNVGGDPSKLSSAAAMEMKALAATRLDGPLSTMLAAVTKEVTDEELEAARETADNPLLTAYDVTIVRARAAAKEIVASYTAVVDRFDALIHLYQDTKFLDELGDELRYDINELLNEMKGARAAFVGSDSPMRHTLALAKGILSDEPDVGEDTVEAIRGSL